ncbi:hypothetical protein K227x_08540 [Rubripirellula lacrimiformis]|uniref:Uncharacterized protein n=1 Tax=Rubripirellula lacrimiformis TaxID=1930273 RepID=A0A517N5Q5_9BACT|nr:hypothetical protein K227x_08540 [Rubripirellula lacrimiformis]
MLVESGERLHDNHGPESSPHRHFGEQYGESSAANQTPPEPSRDKTSHHEIASSQAGRCGAMGRAQITHASVIPAGVATPTRIAVKEFARDDSTQAVERDYCPQPIRPISESVNELTGALCSL